MHFPVLDVRSIAIGGLKLIYQRNTESVFPSETILKELQQLRIRYDMEHAFAADCG